MMRNHPSAAPRGMSLLEVMIALAILAIGLTGATSAVLYSTRALAHSSHVEEASMLAQSLASALASIPYTAMLPGPVSPFSNPNTGNDGDIADSQNQFANATLPSGSWAPDHSESQLAGSQLAAMVAPLPTGRTPYERYFNIAPMPSGNGVMFAVIVRWTESGVFRRTVVVGTRFQP
jgi:prepilin-type N-terminal cleavage/methylation domain-containing protein